ncbi:hypothetical protein AALO_G00013140 [Alosa alosa]|uniref:Uncharacterized protein n=1 Tax=Alosa alosa TaxID=278164 RepID=A0AAV6HIQ4_9TELE|nr:hypothetical protein AALO_G00013140 [Alosa alosa]
MGRRSVLWLEIIDRDNPNQQCQIEEVRREYKEICFPSPRIPRNKREYRLFKDDWVKANTYTEEYYPDSRSRETTGSSEMEGEKYVQLR